MVDIVNKNVFEIMAMSNNWYLLAGFKTIIFCFVHSIRFVKYVLSAKIWFVKALTRIVKYESRVVKLNPAVAEKYYEWTSRENEEVKPVQSV